MVTADTEPVTVESRVKWYHERIPGKRPLWMIDDGEGKMIGWVSVQPFKGRPAYNCTAEVSIYLDSSSRGKGFGGDTLQYCIDNCQRFGIKTLLGFIFAHNEPSRKLFRRFGFQDWGTLPNVAVLDSVERSLIIVGKRISA